MTSQFQHEMRPVSLINDAQIIERILRHVGSVGVSQWVDEIRNHGGPVLGETRTPLDRSPGLDPKSGPFSGGEILVHGNLGLDPKSGPFSGGEILVHGNLVPLT